jgi:hypothetical protein
MFGWFKKKAPDLDPNMEAIFEKVWRFFESEEVQNSMQPEGLRKQMLSGANCDRIPGGYGEFGRAPTNPVPVNGVTGEVLYLSQLRTVSNSPVMFHRVGSALTSNVFVDKYEVMAIDGTASEHLWLTPYHPRKSRVCPTGYRIEPKIDGANPNYGVNALIISFPHHLDFRIREWQQMMLGIPMSIDGVRKYLYGSIPPNLDNAIVWNESAPRQHPDTSGLCFKCWSLKPDLTMACTRCGQQPSTPDQMIYTMALSSVFYDEPALRRMSGMLASKQKTFSMSLEHMEMLRPMAMAFLQKMGLLT